MPTNFALASNGSTVTANPADYYSATTTPAKAIDGSRVSDGNAGGYYNANSAGTRDLTVDFGQSRTITEIDVISLRNAYNDTSAVTLTETFSSYGAVAYNVQYWNGSSWVDIQAVSGNNKVWRQFTFSSITTTKIRLQNITGADNYARIVEVEAWGNSDTTSPSDVTGLTATKVSDSQINIDSNAATDNVGVQQYLTQVSTDNGTSWTSLLQVTKAISFVSGNVGFPNSPGEKNLKFRRKAQDAAGNQSLNWSNMPSVTITVPIPPVVSSINPIPYAKIGEEYSLQLRVTGGSGNFTWTKTIGNLPNGALDEDGLITIGTVGNSNYVFVARVTDDQTGLYDELGFTIQVSEHDWIILKYKRPLNEIPITAITEFPKIEGIADRAQDAPFKYAYDLELKVYGQQTVNELKTFIENHLLGEPFYWYNCDWRETKLVWVKEYTASARDFAYGGVKVILQDV